MRKILFVLIALLFLPGCGKKKNKKITYEIGVDPTWVPLSASGQEKNLFAFSVELLTKIALEENLELFLQITNWDTLISGLEQKKYQAILSSLRPYPFYQAKFSFSSPYLLTGPVWVVPKTSSFSTDHSLIGKEIAVVMGSPSAVLLQIKPGVLVQTYDSVSHALQAVKNEEVDAAVIEILLAQQFVKNLYGNELQIVGPPLNEEGIRLVSLLDQADPLMSRFNQGLSTLKNNGEYEALLQKWDLSQPHSSNYIKNSPYAEKRNQ